MLILFNRPANKYAHQNRPLNRAEAKARLINQVVYFSASDKFVSWLNSAI